MPWWARRPHPRNQFWWTWAILLAVLLLLGAAARAGEACFAQAAAYYQVPEALLRAIAAHESGMKPRAVNRNRDGSEDLGLGQINSRWLPELARMGIHRNDLFDPCVNNFVSAWILAKNLRRANGYVWPAVGAYNAGWRQTPAHAQRRRRYVREIKRQLKRVNQQRKDNRQGAG